MSDSKVAYYLPEQRTWNFFPAQSTKNDLDERPRMAVEPECLQVLKCRCRRFKYTRERGAAGMRKCQALYLLEPGGRNVGTPVIGVNSFAEDFYRDSALGKSGSPCVFHDAGLHRPFCFE